MKANETGKYTWYTEFDQANQTMTHTFSDRVQVVVNWKFSTITLFKDKEVVSKFSLEKDYTLKQYEQFLLNTALSSQLLKNGDYPNPEYDGNDE